MKYYVQGGVYHLDEELSQIERKILRACGEHLERKGFKYLSIPSLISHSTLERQDINLPFPALSPDAVHCLAGSAEQGILEYFADKEIDPKLIYAQNQCFRNENSYQDLVRVKEFMKVEQFCFCTSTMAENSFNSLLMNATSFLDKLSIPWKVIDVSEDQGYHVKKKDILIKTQTFGWIESHSCTYFGEEQSKRFNIRGATHTISCTGIAAPRVLIPFIENSNLAEQAL